MSLKKNSNSIVYLSVALLIFFVEVYIALHVSDSFIRPHGGDLLVGAMLYCLFRGVFRKRKSITAICVFLLAVAIECVQATSLPVLLTELNSSWLPVVVGSRFDVLDIIMYAVGSLISYNIDFWIWDNLIHTT